MRKARLIGEEEVNFYHVILKAPDRTPGNCEYAFGNIEKAKTKSGETWCQSPILLHYNTSQATLFE